MGLKLTGSAAEDLFVDIFTMAFGPDKAGLLYSQYPFYDIYHNSRFIDFVLEKGSHKIAIEIDDAISHHSALISDDKFYDERLRQNSLVYLGFEIYRWPVKLLQQQPDLVKDELLVFLGDNSQFRALADYLPQQKAKSFDGSKLELKRHQVEALDNLQKMRASHESIALLYLATGTGKTVTAVLDAKACGGRVLFLAHTQELVHQAAQTFKKLWPEASLGLYVDGIKHQDCHIVCGSVQSVALNLDSFKDDDFDYLIVDEAHHASSETYQKVLAYFKSKFTLGLTATPERTDDNKIILEIFKNTAHKLDLKSAVEIGELVPVRCIRIHTNIDLSNVRFNSIKYNIRDLESKIFVPERNTLIVKTYLEYVKDKRTVIFCASVKHAQEIAALLNEACVKAVAVSGGMKSSERQEFQAQFVKRQIQVLCACDLLNEGWDCPEIEVLFMARPTMSKVLYTQQLGRGMRLFPGKECLWVFDFVDNASAFNAPQSLHRLFKLKDYHPGKLLLAPKEQLALEDELYRKGEKPAALVDWPVDIVDYELIDLFNWQEEAQGMLSVWEFVRRVDVQSETVNNYIKEGKIKSDLCVNMGGNRCFRYFKEESLQRYAQEFGWRLIDDHNRKQIFLEMIAAMDMTYSYKPVFIKAVLKYADTKGLVFLKDLVAYFREFYSLRRKLGLVVEKSNSLYAQDSYSDKEIENNILKNPFQRFESMNMLHHTKTLGIIQIENSVWKNLSFSDKEAIEKICDKKMAQYFKRLQEQKSQKGR